MRVVVRAILALLAILIVVLAIPFLLNDPPKRGVSGPRLDDLRFEEVSFENGELRLSGMLLLPAGEGPHSAAVFIHGSGTSRRDNPWYLSVAQALQTHGIAVLLPDKRGSERSAGEWRDTSLEELATDTQAAYDFLTTRSEVDPAKIGIVGFSQGGWIAPIVAARNPNIAFVVSMSGAGVTAEEQLLFEEVNNITEMGTYKAVARLLASFTVKNIQKKDVWRAMKGFDPMPFWRDVRVPIFIAFGDGDTNVPVEASIERFNRLPADAFLRVYPSGGHAIADPETWRVQQAFLDDLVAFIDSGGTHLAVPPE